MDASAPPQKLEFMAALGLVPPAVMEGNYLYDNYVPKIFYSQKFADVAFSLVLFLSRNSSTAAVVQSRIWQLVGQTPQHSKYTELV